MEKIDIVMKNPLNKYKGYKMQAIIDSILNWTLAVDWVKSVKDWVGIIKDLATGGAAIFAMVKYKSWREEIDFKQKKEIASTLMRTTYKIQNAFSDLYINQPIFDRIIELLKTEEFSNDNIAEMHGFYIILIRYFNKIKELISEFETQCFDAYIINKEGISKIQKDIRAQYNVFSLELTMLSEINNPINFARAGRSYSEKTTEPLFSEITINLFKSHLDSNVLKLEDLLKDSL